MNDTSFHDQNRASAVMMKVGNGQADAEFARAAAECVARSTQTGKKSKLIVTLEFNPRDDLGSLEVRADVATRLPRLPSPASQMHIGPEGQLLTQLEFIMGNGPSEPKPLPVAVGAAKSSTSGRLAVASLPAPAPLVQAPAPAPLVGGPSFTPANPTGKEAGFKD